MSRDKRIFDLEECLIAFAVRIIRAAESLPKTRITKLHNSKFLVRYSLFITRFNESVILT